MFYVRTHPLSSLLFATVYFGVIASVLYACSVLDGTNPWERWGVKYEPGPWCERERTANLIREPSNTYSNFSFLAVTCFMLYIATCEFISTPNAHLTARGDGDGAEWSQDNLLLRAPSLSLLWGIANLIHYLGTTFYHSCRCREGHILDLVGMYSITAFPGFFNLARRHFLSVPKRQRAEAAVRLQLIMWLTCSLFALACYLICSSRFYSDTLRDVMMGVVVLFVVASIVVLNTNHMKGKQQQREATAAHIVVVLFAAGLTAHTMDRLHIMCDPDGVVQGHAFWHFINAVGLMVMYITFHGEGFASVWSSFEDSLLLARGARPLRSL